MSDSLSFFVEVPVAEPPGNRVTGLSPADSRLMTPSCSNRTSAIEFGRFLTIGTSAAARLLKRQFQVTHSSRRE